jgi:hypothetical protein
MNRPLSNSPTASKIAENVVYDQLVSYLNKGTFTLHPMHWSFRKHHSTEEGIDFFQTNQQFLDKCGVV